MNESFTRGGCFQSPLFFYLTNMFRISGLPIYALFIGALFIGCSANEEKKPNKLLLISIDGFRADYTELHNTPFLDELANNGVKAEYMIPVFPTKTFPNHYSIATGRFVENTGLISNNMYDEEFDEYYSLANRDAVQSAKWYEGEPIWVTAERQGIRTAPLFWPGSEAPIGGQYPSRWDPYDDNLPYKARVDSVLYWLQLEDESAPGFMTLYFSKVDTYGHRYGPESDSTAAAVKEVDEMIGYLIEELEYRNLQHHLNIIIVSDHGMMSVSKEKVIDLNNLIPLGDVEIIDLAPVTAIRTTEQNRMMIYEQLKRSEDHYKVYLKDEIPEKWGYKNHKRVPDMILVADPGYTIRTSAVADSDDFPGGNHGYAPETKEMRSLFIASGPDIKKGVTAKPFQNIHLYELMTNLLDIEPAPNDGSLDSLKTILTP
jgi:predicted AlkP superfamily pyrophosphatase or phosphodiesterase